MQFYPAARIVAYDVFGKRRGATTDFTSLEFVQALNAPSTCKLTIPATGHAAELLTPPVEFALETPQGSRWEERANSRFLCLKIERDLAAPADTIIIDGIGIAVTLDWVSVWDATEGNREGKRVFNAQTPGAILHTLLQAASTRTDTTGRVWGKGALSWDFTSEADSGHEKWGKNAAKTFSTSTPLSRVLGWLADKGAVDWRWQGRALQVYRTNGTMAIDASEAFDITNGAVTAKPTTTTWEQLCTTARFRGDEGYLREKTNPAASSVFGRIERWSEQGQVTRDATADLYLEELLRRGEQPIRQWRREWAYPTAMYEGFRWPDVTQVGLWLTMNGEKLRVVETGVTIAADGTITGWETLGTRLESLLEKLARRTTDLSDGAVGSDSGGPTPAGEDTRTPNPPTDVLAESDTIVTEEGAYRGIVTVSWTPPTKATNGTELTPTAYRVWARETGSNQLRLEAQTDAVDRVSLYATPGVDVEVFVQAGTDKGYWSQLSQPARVHVETDTTPPPTPSAPRVRSDLGVVEISTDGLSAAGDKMPPDFSHYEIYVTRQDLDAAVAESLTPAPQIVATGGEGQWWFPAPAYGEWFVSMVAVDRAGNRSTLSLAVGVEVRASVDTDVIQHQIDQALKDWQGDRAYLDEKLADLDKKNQAAREAIQQEIQAVADKTGTPVSWVVVPDGTQPTYPDNPKNGDIVFVRHDHFGPIRDIVKYDHGYGWMHIPIADVALSNIDIAKLVVRDREVSQTVADAIWARKIAANKITADEIVTGVDFDSLLPPPHENWRSYTKMGSTWNVNTKQQVWTTDANTTNGELITPWMPIGANDDLVVSFDAWGTQAGTQRRIELGVDWDDGTVTRSKVLRATKTLTGTSRTHHELDISVAALMSAASISDRSDKPQRIRLSFVIPSGGGAQVVIDTLQVVRAAGATRIAGGSITTDKIAALAVNADKIATNAVTADKIKAGSIQATHIAANAVTARTIKSDAIDGMTITGALIQNERGNRGLKISGGKIWGYNSRGVQSLYIDHSMAHWTSPKDSNNWASITTIGDRERVTLQFHAPISGYDVNTARIFVPTSGEIGTYNPYTQGTFVISGIEKTLNYSGRAELQLGEGVYWKLGSVWGSARYQAYILGNGGPGNDNAGELYLHGGEKVNVWTPGTVAIHAGTGIDIRGSMKRPAHVHSEVTLTDIPITTGGVPLVFRASTWQVHYQSSRRDTKSGIRDIKVDPARLLDVPVRDWYDKADLEGYANRLEDQAGAKTGKWDNELARLRRIPGLVAEEVEEAGLEQFLIYDNDGQIRTLMYDKLWTLLIPLVKDLRERVRTLEIQGKDPQ